MKIKLTMCACEIRALQAILQSVRLQYPNRFPCVCPNTNAAFSVSDLCDAFTFIDLVDLTPVTS